MYIARHEIDKLNPWAKLPAKPPFILDDDKRAIAEYDRDQRTGSDNQVHSEIPPNPFVGSPFKAKILILTKAPTWDENNIREFQDNAEYAEQMRQNLTFANRESDYPFYFINPAFEGTAGYEWWYPKLRELIEACDARTDGCGRECVAQGLFTIAYFPYHIQDYNGRCRELHCQKYGFGLVSLLRREDVPIIITSYQKDWKLQLNRLDDGAAVKSSPRSNFVSKGNMAPGVFDTLVDALTQPEAE